MNGHLYTNGQWHPGDGAAFSSNAPADGQALWEGAFAAETQARTAVQAAADAFSLWAALPLDQRVVVIERFSAIAAERKDEMAKLIANETGKALWDATTEAGAVAGKAAVSLAAYHDRTPTKDEGAIQLTHRPHGVMAVIGPFNFPAHLPNGHIIPALIAGNTIVLKPSEQTPAVAELMVRWWDEAGLPKGVLNLVHGGADIAQAVITHEKTAGILFTGGVTAGLAIHRMLAGHPDKILALELGGNNPLVAWDLDDAEAAARVIVRSAYITSGQRCTCARRLIVEEGLAGDRIVDAVAALIPRLRVGAPLSEPQPFYGPQINARAAAAALKAQSAMLAAGATAVVEATGANAGPASLTPGLIDTTQWRERNDEEVFAPLLQVVRVGTVDAAIDAANATRYGLSAGLLSDNADLWSTFKADIRAGIVNWNRQTTGASGKAPFGGPGFSGNHRPAGYYAADYCAWPMASMVSGGPLKDEADMPGLMT